MTDVVMVKQVLMDDIKLQGYQERDELGPCWAINHRFHYSYYDPLMHTFIYYHIIFSLSVCHWITWCISTNEDRSKDLAGKTHGNFPRDHRSSTEKQGKRRHHTAPVTPSPGALPHASGTWAAGCNVFFWGGTPVAMVFVGLLLQLLSFWSHRTAPTLQHQS